MFEPLIWWLLVELIGLAVWPVAFRFFRNLPDRGYAFVKPLGLLLSAYPFWLLASFGFLSNTQGAIALLAVLVATVSWGVWGRQPTIEYTTKVATSVGQQTTDDRREAAEVKAQAPSPSTTSRNSKRRAVPVPAAAQVTKPAMPDGADAAPESLDAEPLPSSQPTVAPKVTASPITNYSPFAWLREHLTLVITTEIVFTFAFASWVVVRAYMPEITATEKPMEFAFLNGILRSDRFPPQDPWLSGYAISYYYFGYVIMAMLTMLGGISSSIAFNLAIALLFALAATGAFGLTYNLIRSWRLEVGSWKLEVPTPTLPHSHTLLFALFAPILLLLIGNLEGLFEALHARGLGTPEFWNWLDIKGLAEAPVTGSLVPTDNWWWWRASRVIHDVARGQTQEVIDEFPQFSFLLGDMHPHVLALPFVLLALAVALNLIRSRKHALSGVEGLEGGSWKLPLATSQFPLRTFHFLLLTLIFGALPFLNFWDILPYGFIVVAAFAIARYRAANAWDGGATRDLAVFVVGLGLGSLLLYLPFYIGFQSQAGGILPVLFVKTRLHQYLVMFGVFVFIFVLFLARLLYEYRRQLTSPLPFLTAILVFPLLVGALAIGLIVVSPSLQDQARAAFPDSSGNLVGNVLAAYFGPLIADPWLFILLAIVLLSVLVLLRTHVVAFASADPTLAFVLLMIFTGFLLTFGVEFVYLRDVFGTRMNTVFKFYFQTWTLFSIAGAFAIFYLSRAFGRIPLARWLWFAALAVLLGVSLIYPAAAIPNRAEGFKRPPTLDGIEWIRGVSAGDYAGIQWLKENAPRGARILESTGRSYTYDNRISMATGLPTVLGWIGHEDQWRGGAKLYRNELAGIDRAADAARIYQTLDARDALTLLDKYAINFVVVGQVERAQYNLNPAQINKFDRVLTLVFENGDLRIYARSQ
ncbi:MAG: hypothetical protein HY782_28655 [Chloroflexi bacterium]|nr:hypothetical protein [Chloroflexota bacterium]